MLKKEVRSAVKNISFVNDLQKAINQAWIEKGTPVYLLQVSFQGIKDFVFNIDCCIGISLH